MSIPAKLGAERCTVRCLHPETVARAQAALEDEASYIQLAELFGALADTTRAKIIHTLARKELGTCEPLSGRGHHRLRCLPAPARLARLAVSQGTATEEVRLLESG